MKPVSLVLHKYERWLHNYRKYISYILCTKIRVNTLMKYKFFNAITVTFLVNTNAFAFDAKFADDVWDKKLKDTH